MGEDTLSWALTFGEDDPWFGQLFLQQSGGRCRGSIATATGDFRHLHGKLMSGELVLQTFDGAHLFRFAGSLDADGSIRDGVFHSGNHYATPFSGRPVTPLPPPWKTLQSRPGPDNLCSMPVLTCKGTACAGQTVLPTAFMS